MGVSLWEAINQTRAARLRRGPLTRPVKLTANETYLVEQLVGYMYGKRGGFANDAALLSDGLRSSKPRGKKPAWNSSRPR